MWDPQCGILTEQHGWSDNLSREYLHSRGQRRRELELGCTIPILRRLVLARVAVGELVLRSARGGFDVFVPDSPWTMSIGDATHPGAKRAVAQAALLHQDGFSLRQRGASWSSPASGVGSGPRAGG